MLELETLVRCVVVGSGADEAQQHNDTSGFKEEGEKKNACKDFYMTFRATPIHVPASGGSCPFIKEVSLHPPRT